MRITDGENPHSGEAGIGGHFMIPRERFEVEGKVCVCVYPTVLSQWHGNLLRGDGYTRYTARERRRKKDHNNLYVTQQLPASLPSQWQHMLSSQVRVSFLIPPEHKIIKEEEDTHK